MSLSTPQGLQGFASLATGLERDKRKSNLGMAKDKKCNSKPASSHKKENKDISDSGSTSEKTTPVDTISGESNITSNAEQTPEKPTLKGILKRVRDHPNKKVDFNLQVECIPFDPSDDFCVEIKIVEKIVHIKSWAAIMEQRRREAQEAANKEATATETTSETDDNEETELLSSNLSKKILQRQRSPMRANKRVATASEPNVKNVGVPIENNAAVIVVDS